MTNTYPLPITPEELREISRSEELQEMWGAENSEEMLEVLSGEYIAKFDFMNQSPGYCGDLIVIQSSCLSDEIPAIRLCRDHNKELVVVR